MATKIELEAKLAQGEDVGEKLEEELAKLETNIAIDEENAGIVSTAVEFDADIIGGADVDAATAGEEDADNTEDGNNGEDRNNDNLVDDNRDNANANRFRTREDANDKLAVPVLGNRRVHRRGNKK
jgi:hypothetical protein